MPVYEHFCGNCNEEFEDIYSAQSPVLTLCPLCGVDGKVKRQIPSIVHGRVPLTGQELKQQLKKDSVSIKNKIKKDENLKANIVGEQKYEQHVQAVEKLNATYKD